MVVRQNQHILVRIFLQICNKLKLFEVQKVEQQHYYGAMENIL